MGGEDPVKFTREHAESQAEYIRAYWREPVTKLTLIEPISRTYASDFQ